MINKIINKVVKKIKQYKLIKSLNFKYHNNIIFLGTEYGGWSFYNSKKLYNSTIILAGLGTDASFDIELINKFNLRVIAVDPTPEAIKFYNSIINYSKTKNKFLLKKKLLKLNIKNINQNNFILIKKALYNVDLKRIKFYLPPNKNHTSHSINNWQNNWKKNTEHIEVKTISVKTIMKKYKIKNLELIKLDIEGAEIEVIKDLLSKKTLPNQICVEFDELNNFNKRSVDKFLSIHKRLSSNGYFLTKNISKFPNFHYLRTEV